jgi:hypothetical protein
MRAHHFLGIAAVIVLGFVLQQLLFGSPIAEAEMPAPQMDHANAPGTPSYGRHEGGPNTRQVDGVHRSRVMRWAKACDQGPRFLGRSDGIPTRSYAERARRLGAPCVSRSDARALSEVGRSSGGRPFLFRPSTNVANLRVLPSLACSGRAGGEEEFRCRNLQHRQASACGYCPSHYFCSGTPRSIPVQSEGSHAFAVRMGE